MRWSLLQNHSRKQVWVRQPDHFLVQDDQLHLARTPIWAVSPYWHNSWSLGGYGGWYWVEKTLAASSFSGIGSPFPFLLPCIKLNITCCTMGQRTYIHTVKEGPKWIESEHRSYRDTLRRVSCPKEAVRIVGETPQDLNRSVNFG